MGKGMSLASRMFLTTMVVAGLILTLFLWTILGTLSATSVEVELRGQLALAKQETGRLIAARDSAKDELVGLARELADPRASQLRPLLLRMVSGRPWLLAVWLENGGRVLLAEPQGPRPHPSAAAEVVSFPVGRSGDRLFAVISLPALAAASLPHQKGWLLVSRQGQVVWASARPQGLDLGVPPFSTVIAAGRSRSFPSGGHLGIPNIVGYVPLPQSTVGILDVHEDGLITTVRALQRQLFLTALLVVLAAVPLFLLLARSLSRPLRDLGESLRQLEAGVTPSLRRAASGIIEVDRVQGAIQRLSNALADRHGEVRQAVLAVGKAMAARSGREAALRHLLETALLLTHSEQGVVVLMSAQGQVDNLLCAHREAESTGPCDLDPATVAFLTDGQPEAIPPTLQGRHCLALPVGGEGPRASMLLIKPEGAVPFTPYERDMAALMGETIQTALANQSTFEAALRAAETDTITGLYNFRYFLHELQRAFLRYERHGTVFSIILMDLDYFKTINDRYGHLVGDGVLRGIGEALEHVLRATDVLARYGGEEFVVLLSGTTGTDALTIAERIRRAIEEESWTERIGVSLRTTASLGVASPGNGRETPEGLLAAADHAMYAAKREGRNRVVTADSEGG